MNISISKLYYMTIIIIMIQLTACFNEINKTMDDIITVNKGIIELIMNNEEICDPNKCEKSEKEYGECIENKCICKPGYDYGDSLTSCDYTRQTQLTVLLIELIFSMGIGHFLLGHMFLGLIKLFFTFTPCLFGILSACSLLPIKHYERFFGPCTGIIMLLCALTFIAWWIIDIFLFLFYYKCDVMDRSIVLFFGTYNCPMDHKVLTN